MFEVGELSGIIKEVVKLSKGVLPFKNIKTECSTEADGQRVYRISLTFDSNLNGLISATLGSLGIIKQLSIVANLAQGPGDKAEEGKAGASLAFSADVGLSEDVVRGFFFSSKSLGVLSCLTTVWRTVAQACQWCPWWRGLGRRGTCTTVRFSSSLRHIGCVLILR